VDNGSVWISGPIASRRQPCDNPSMAKISITPKEAAELRQLWNDLDKAHKQAVSAFRSHPEGESLAVFWETVERVDAIVRRIKEIQHA
jgi:hypothetical protein